MNRSNVANFVALTVHIVIDFFYQSEISESSISL